MSTPATTRFGQPRSPLPPLVAGLAAAAGGFLLGLLPVAALPAEGSHVIYSLAAPVLSAAAGATAAGMATRSLTRAGRAAATAGGGAAALAAVSLMLGAGLDGAVVAAAIAAGGIIGSTSLR